MKSIWKFSLTIQDSQKIKIPAGSKILSIQMQNGIPCIWALVNPDDSKRDKTIRIYSTGRRVESHHGDFIGTFQTGPLVFHAFDEGF